MTTNPCNVNTVRCAVCGKLREQANHWFVIWLNAGPRPPRKTAAGVGAGFHCYPFEMAPRRRDDLPVCGQACAQKEFERWMTAMRNAGGQDPGLEEEAAIGKSQLALAMSPCDLSTSSTS